MKRPYGSGHLYVKSGAYYGRWRKTDGRFVNRRRLELTRVEDRLALLPKAARKRPIDDIDLDF